MSIYRNAVFIKLPFSDKNYSLCIEHEDERICEQFKAYCIHNLNPGLDWFLQSNSKNFKMFEFWFDFEDEKNREKVNQVLILCLKVSSNLELEANID